MQVTPQQLKARDMLVRNKGGVVWWRVGTGKTRIAISWFAFNAKFQKGLNFLVVCRREAFGDWEEELRKVGLTWRFIHLESPHQFDLSLLNSKQPTLYIMSHGKLARMRDELRNVASVFHAVVYDEGFLYKNSQTDRCKAAHLLSDAIGQAAILSGSVMTARNTEDIYGQLFAINRQQPIGRTLTEFRSRYRLELRLTNPTGSVKGPRWANRAHSLDAITAATRGIRSVYFPANNKRRVVETVRVCSASRAQARAFQELRNYYELQFDGRTDEVIIKNTPSLILKCQQISDGWIQMGKTETGADGEIVELPVCDKLNYLRGYVEELMDAGERVAIWVAFRHSVRLVLHSLQKAFPRLGIYTLTGGKPFDRSGWNRCGRIFIGTEASGSSVNYLRDCAYSTYYSMDFHWLHLQQSQGRTNRHDSAHDTCHYSFLQTEGSLDSHVLKMVRASRREESRIIQLATVDAVKSWLKQ